MLPRAVIWSCVSSSPTHDAPNFTKAQLADDALWKPPTWAKLIAYMMQPAVLTLEAGFAANNFSTILGGGPPALITSGLLESLGPADVFVWVGVGNMEWRVNRHATGFFVQTTLQQLTARGVLTVFYSTESFMHMSCVKKRSLPVREIWEYTRTNTLCCPDDPAAARVRYVPPGYHQRLHLAGSLVTGGHSRASTPPKARVAPPRLVFFGSAVSWYWMRYSCLRHVATGLIRSWAQTDPQRAPQLNPQCASTACGRCANALCPLYTAHDATDARSWDTLVGGNRYFLNVHKICDWATNDVDPFASSNASCESFRLASLLSAGAEVFSEHCHPADEAEYRGLVRFLPIANISDEVMAAWRAANRSSTSTSRIADGGADQASTDQGPSSAETRAREFSTRFAPAAIFDRAGITKLLAAHRLGTEVRVTSGGRRGREAATELHQRFPDVPSFCCMTESECNVHVMLTHIRVRGNLTALHEWQAENIARRRNQSRAAPRAKGGIG